MRKQVKRQVRRESNRQLLWWNKDFEEQLRTLVCPLPRLPLPAGRKQRDFAVQSRRGGQLQLHTQPLHSPLSKIAVHVPKIRGE